MMKERSRSDEERESRSDYLFPYNYYTQSSSLPT